MSEGSEAPAEGEPGASLPEPVSDDTADTPSGSAPEPAATPSDPSPSIPDAQASTTERRQESPTARLSRGDFSAALQAPFVRPILGFPLRKVVIWGSLFGLLFLANEFFSVILLTFVISYMSVSVVDRLAPFLKHRKLSVFLVYLAIVGALIAMGYSLVPGALAEGKKQLVRVKQIEDPKSFVEARVDAMIETYPVLQGWGIDERVSDILKEEQSLKAEDWKEIIGQLGGVWTIVWKGFLNVGIALIFSFMVVWDMPKMQGAWAS